MPRTYTADRVREMAESGICEPSRLVHILRMMSAGKPLYKSDVAYLDRVAARLSGKEADLRRENQRIRRVLGSALGGAPAPVSPIDAPAAGTVARAPAADALQAAPVSRSNLPARREGGRPPVAGAPPPAPARAAPAGRPLVDGDLLDEVLESRERKRRSSARETTAAAAAAATASAAGAAHAAEQAFSSPSSPAAEPPSRRRDGSLTRRLRGMAAGRR